MNTLIHGVQLATILSFITSFLIPYLSALVTRQNGWWTGFATLVLAAASGFFAEWAVDGDKFNWTAAALTSIIDAAIAWGSHSKWLKGTDVEAALLQFPKPVTSEHRAAA